MCKDLCKSGQKGVLIFGISDRHFGSNIEDFFASYKSKTFDLINLVDSYDNPEISISK